MVIDDSKLIFSSSWDIDQILRSGELTITAPVTSSALPIYDTSGDIEVVDFSDLGLDYPPMYFLSWRSVGKTKWNTDFSPGGIGEHVGVRRVTTRILNNKLYIFPHNSVSEFQMEVRYIIYKDAGQAWL